MTSRTPQFQQYSFENTLHIIPTEAFELIKNDKAVLLDVREEYETAQGKPDLSSKMLAIPMSLLTTKLDLIPRDKPLIVMCAHGIRSVQVVAYLSQFLSVACYNLDGAFEYWELQGLPVTIENVSGNR
ncbi:MAG: rhodanese-like domain-containing protein [Bacteroidales bacterium]|nr:rhodanese-like domain-containing protein [Bacteroidales bacterium]